MNENAKRTDARWHRPSEFVQEDDGISPDQDQR